MNYTFLTLVAVNRTLPPALPVLQAEPPLGRLVNGLIVLGLLTLVCLCFVAFIVLLAVLFPSMAEHSKQALQHSPWRAFFIGLANYLFLGGISLALLSQESVAWLGVLLASGLTVVTSLGLAGLISLVGERLAGLHRGEFSPLQQLVWGSVVVELAGLLPFAGWFVLTPVLVMLAFGAVVLGWRQRRRNQNG